MYHVHLLVRSCCDSVGLESYPATQITSLSQEATRPQNLNTTRNASTAYQTGSSLSNIRCLRGCFQASSSAWVPNRLNGRWGCDLPCSTMAGQNQDMDPRFESCPRSRWGNLFRGYPIFHPPPNFSAEVQTVDTQALSHLRDALHACDSDSARKVSKGEKNAPNRGFCCWLSANKTRRCKSREHHLQLRATSLVTSQVGGFPSGVVQQVGLDLTKLMGPMYRSVGEVNVSIQKCVSETMQLQLLSFRHEPQIVCALVLLSQQGKLVVCQNEISVLMCFALDRFSNCMMIPADKMFKIMFLPCESSFVGISFEGPQRKICTAESVAYFFPTNLWDETSWCLGTDQSGIRPRPGRRLCAQLSRSVPP